MATKSGTEITIPLPDGDALLNIHAISARLQVKPDTLYSYMDGKRQTGNPFPKPEPDPVALLIPDPATADSVRKLLLAGTRRAGDNPAPALWRRSAIDTWQANRRGRGNWR